MLNVEAQALAFALEAGAADASDARDWAANQIASAPSASDELLDLATEQRLPDAVSLLHALGRDAPRQPVGKLVYRHLLSAVSTGRITHERAALTIYRLTLEQYAPSEEAEKSSWYFVDAFFLAREGTYGTESQVVAEVELHLKRHAA